MLGPPRAEHKLVEGVRVYTIESQRKTSGVDFDFVYRLDEVVRGVHAVRLASVTLPRIEDIISGADMSLRIGPAIAEVLSAVRESATVLIDDARSIVLHADASQGVMHLVEILADRVEIHGPVLFNRLPLIGLRAALLANTPSLAIVAIVYRETQSELAQDTTVLRLAVIVKGEAFTRPARISFSSEIAVATRARQQAVHRLSDDDAAVVTLSADGALSVARVSLLNTRVSEQRDESDSFTQTLAANSTTAFEFVELDGGSNVLVLTRHVDGALRARAALITAGEVRIGLPITIPPDVPASIFVAFAGVSSPTSRTTHSVAVVRSTAASTIVRVVLVDTATRTVRLGQELGSFCERPLPGRLLAVSTDPLPGRTYGLFEQPLAISAIRVGGFKARAARTIEGVEVLRCDETLSTNRVTADADTVELELASLYAPSATRTLVAYAQSALAEPIAVELLFDDDGERSPEILVVERGNALRVQNDSNQRSCSGWTAARRWTKRCRPARSAYFCRTRAP